MGGGGVARLRGFVFSVCRYLIPVPGMPAENVRRPVADVEMCAPRVPTDTPMPRFEKLMRTPGAIFIDRLTYQPIVDPPHHQATTWG